ncbi:acyloxyacyl hydrolase [Rurimicrobium arvi]|uniref:acyloxyacyl hydrolase n=1 Tax=Rurimicrobium arvi TaxID=2049916 RepID=UPI0031D89E1F
MNPRVYVFRLPLLYLHVLLAVLCGSLTAFAQAEEGFGIEANPMAGRVFKHTKRFLGPIPPVSGGLDLNFLWKTRGNKDWQYRRHFPTVGIGITYTSYDRQYYGQGIGFYPNLELPLIRGNRLEWCMRFGMGLGYISKHYTRYAPDYDTLNNAIGGHINNFSLLASDLRLHLNKHWDVQAGINFTHMSSAKFRLPNLGINLLAGHIGVRYFPNTSSPARREKKVPALSNRWLLQFRQGIAMSTGESIGSTATPVYLSALYISKRYWSKNKVFAGIDYSYHESLYNFQRLQGIHPGDEKQYAWKSGVYAGHEFLYGHVGLMMQIGVYIHQAILPSPLLYEKLGMNWYLLQSESGIVKECWISTLLKTHYSTAELAELGVGVSF